MLRDESFCGEIGEGGSGENNVLGVEKVSIFLCLCWLPFPETKTKIKRRRSSEVSPGVGKLGEHPIHKVCPFFAHTLLPFLA